MFLPLTDGEIATSLRLPLRTLSPTFDSRSRMIFYAATLGAFVDLAADLGHALHAPALSADSPDRAEGPGGGRPPSDGQHDEPEHGELADERAIVLDADLPPHTLVARLTGLDEISAINRAVGMLIEQGHHPDEAHATLRRHAVAAGVAPHIYAAQLLQR
jgi:hypothetical protein